MGNIFKIQEKVFLFLLYSTHILLFLSLIGVTVYAPAYVNNIDFYLRLYTCLFLIWRFHPFRSHYKFTELDRKIAFSAGIFILTTSILNKYIETTKTKIQKRISTHLKSEKEEN